MHKNKGFTLIEVLIAIAIYAVVIAIASMVLSNILTKSSGLLTQSTSFNQLQRTITLLQHDFIQTIDRPILNETNEQEPAILSPRRSNNFILELSVYQTNRPFFAANQSDIRRIGYQLKNKQLVRLVWSTLDRLSNNHSKQVLLDNIESLDWQYLADNQVFYDTWPPYNVETTDLPRAIQMKIHFNDKTTMDKLFLVTG